MNIPFSTHKPEEDELSKKVTQKTAATSYYVSLFHWLVLIYIHSHGTINIDCLLSIGALEKGKYNPSLKLAYDISKVFEQSIENVFIFD